MPANTLPFRAERLQVGVVRDGKAQLVPVKIGRDYGDKVEITSGLDANDQAILDPSDSLVSDTPVQIQVPKKGQELGIGEAVAASGREARKGVSMMKPALPILAFALLAGCTAQPQPPQQVAAAQNGVCLKSYMIDHTSIPDDKTILFAMKDGTVWQNSLPFSCPGLSFEGGFEFTASFDEVCSNAQAIRVLRQNSQCMLGAFTPYSAPKAQ